MLDFDTQSPTGGFRPIGGVVRMRSGTCTWRVKVLKYFLFFLQEMCIGQNLNYTLRLAIPGLDFVSTLQQSKACNY